jgi:23S rRNA (adenine2503-C2)-methyltransferase
MAALSGATRDARSARLLYRQACVEGRFEPERFFSARASDAIRSALRLDLPEVVAVERETGPDGETMKAALRFRDGEVAECVRIPQPGGRRSTLCVSSQIGCRMGCAFCETAAIGFKRQMSASEIASQATVAKAVLGWEFSNIVFMGMGEPLDNLTGLAGALAALFNVAGWNFAQDRITVCTAGLAEAIPDLKRLGYRRMNLSVSLNSAFDTVRSRLMPVNNKYPLEVLASALSRYGDRPNFFLGVNYCLLPGINDSERDADAVAEFVSRVGKVMVNVIPYNPGSVPIARAPEIAQVDAFTAKLYARGVAVRRRATRGRRIMAGCGQLGRAAARTAGKTEEG